MYTKIDIKLTYILYKYVKNKQIAQATNLIQRVI